jgi:ABC-2 type transport system permease protein
MNFNTLAAFIKISFKANFAYRSAALMGFIGSIASVLVQMAIWAYIFRADPAMLKYMLAYVVLAQFLWQLFNNWITGDVASRIASGAFATDLIKPANLVLVYAGPAVGTTLANVLIRGLPLLLVLSPVLAGAVHAGPARLLVFLCICSMAYVMACLIYMLTGFLAFITTEANWFPRILTDTVNFFSGAAIPLAFFPGWLGAAL